MDSIFIYDPEKRDEAWRFLTYAVLHKDYEHLIGNVCVGLIVGFLLELVINGEYGSFISLVSYLVLLDRPLLNHELSSSVPLVVVMRLLVLMLLCSFVVFENFHDH